MQRESANLDRQFKLIEKSYGADHLDLVLVNGYVAKLLGNAMVVRFLAQHYAEILVEFQKLVDAKTAATRGRRVMDVDGDPDPKARGPRETPHGGADKSRWWEWRRTRSEPTPASGIPAR